MTETELVHSLANPANRWLANLAIQWQVISTINRENREVGLSIFRALLSHEGRLDGDWNLPGRILVADVHEAKWGRIPRLSHIFNAASRNCNAGSVFFCGESQSSTTRLTPELVMETWVMGSTDFAGLCSILSIPDPKAEEKYLPTLPAHVASSPRECKHWKNPTTGSTWDFCAVPGAGLTWPHVDSWASEVYISHIQGKKLWLLWPGTTENYQLLYGSLFAGSNNRLDTAKAIEVLQGLEVFFVSDDDPPLGWTLPAGTIHAVLTFSRAAIHGGFYYMSISGWKQCQNAVHALQNALGL